MSEPNFASSLITSQHDGPHVLITGGVHGDEFEPIVAIRRLGQLLSFPNAVYPLTKGKLTLIPVVNEAAFLRGNRVADDGLDLARVCPGDPQGTVTERIAARLSRVIETADYYIDLHTGGVAMSVAPLVGYTLHADYHVLTKQRAMAKVFNLPIVWGTSPGLDGRSLSVARDAKIPAIYAEYFGTAGLSNNACEDYVDGCLNVLTWLNMVERATPPSRVQTIVEDPSPESGHLQACNPSPVTGLFEPAVEIGQRVNIGQPLGTVTELSGRSHNMTVMEDGMVLVLRTFPRVLQGHALAVILPDPTAP